MTAHAIVVLVGGERVRVAASVAEIVSALAVSYVFESLTDSFPGGDVLVSFHMRNVAYVLPVREIA